MSTAIRVEGLGKRYAINQGSSASAASIRDAMARHIGRVLGRGGPQRAMTEEEIAAAAAAEVAAAQAKEFWALKDVNFEVGEGERVGIIGANGAGKSTLLKILSRVTAPTEGRIEIRGKVASLLEVGTGFHPELSGRENVFLNGAILGMSTVEIRKKFHQIVEFSGVERFLDTPVKHYSSGMYVRLAFSVSAWLDPDILIVDEVLAVGDAAFQKKCAERIKDLTKEGRTVLFVSHSMATVNQMCQKALYLEHGRVVAFKPVEEATVEYQRHVIEEIEQGPWHRAEFTVPDTNIEIYSDRQGEVECLGGAVETEAGGIAERLPIEQAIRLTVRYRVPKDLAFAVVPNFHIYDENSVRVLITMPPEPASSKAGDYSATCTIPPFQLNNGRFMAMLAVSSFTEDKPVHFAMINALRFEVVEEPGIDPRRHGWTKPLPGLSRPRLDWVTTRELATLSARRA